jgi:YVTN family beta-propeller protein
VIVAAGMKRWLLLPAAVLVAAICADSALGFDDGHTYRAQFERESKPFFGRPHDLVLSPDGRYLYVADMDNHEVKVLDPDSLAILGSIGQGELRAPHDVTFDLQERLYVADSGNDRIMRYKVQGRVVLNTEVFVDGLASPEGVVVDAFYRVYVVNTASDTLVRIDVDGSRREIGGGGAIVAAFSRPHDVDIGWNQLVYVADPGRDRIQVFSTELNFVRALEAPRYLFRQPKYLATNERGWLLVADEDNHQIKIFDERYDLVGVIGDETQGRGPERLRKPEGVTIRGDMVWVSDTYNNRIVRFRLVPSSAGRFLTPPRDFRQTAPPIRRKAP